MERSVPAFRNGRIRLGILKYVHYYVDGQISSLVTNINIYTEQNMREQNSSVFTKKKKKGKKNEMQMYK